MKATIISDASWCHRSGAGGWAAWAKADGSDSVIWSGSFDKRAPATAGEAELFAIANALHQANASGMLEDGAQIMLQSDCLYALGCVLFTVKTAVESKHKDGAALIPPKKPRFSDNVRSALAHIVEIVSERGFVLSLRHVRGHTEGGGRQWVNRQCDLAARKAMRAARAKGQKH
jgi:ribonuclease HI